MKIQILGTGCKKCEDLAANAEKAATEAGLEFELVKVKELSEIMAMGVMLTPAMAVDGDVKVSGRVPDVDELKAMLTS